MIGKGAALRAFKVHNNASKLNKKFEIDFLRWTSTLSDAEKQRRAKLITGTKWGRRLVLIIWHNAHFNYLLIESSWSNSLSLVARKTASN